MDKLREAVISAEAGIHFQPSFDFTKYWIPASAGMTEFMSGQEKGVLVRTTTNVTGFPLKPLLECLNQGRERRGF